MLQEIMTKYSLVIGLVGYGIIIYLFLIMPNKKKKKKHKEMVDSLKQGKEIITTGGIKGEVISTTEEFVIVKVDKGVKLTLIKSAIGKVL
jgi:preprotein translocase subunit YajC